MLQADRPAHDAALAESSASEGELPFAAVIARNAAFLCESTNRVRRDHDVNSHAEIVAISQAQLIEAVFYRWNPLIWQVIKARGVFVDHTGENS